MSRHRRIASRRFAEILKDFVLFAGNVEYVKDFQSIRLSGLIVNLKGHYDGRTRRSIRINILPKRPIHKPVLYEIHTWAIPQSEQVIGVIGDAIH